MSTTTVSLRSTTQDADLAYLRALEADARAAARRAAARAEAERRRAEAERRRIELANRTIAEQDATLQSSVARLDAAARRLPDFALRVPAIPPLSSEIAGDPDRLESHAAQMRTAVERFVRQLDAAIAEGERLLKRRIAKAEAWRVAGDLEQQLALRTQACRELADRLGGADAGPLAPAKPHAEADLEPVQGYVEALRTCLAERDTQHAGLCAQVASWKRAAALGGTSLSTSSAADALSRHDTKRRSDALAELSAYRDATLVRAGLTIADLPRSVCTLIEDALADAHVQDQRERLGDLIGREQERRTGVERALTLLQCVPNLVHEDRTLAERWRALTARLQRVASGLDHFESHIEREYEQLSADAQRLLNSTFTKADWVRAMRAQEFEVCEREDGQGLVVVDLDHPEIWLEATELETQQGGFAVTLELKTDASSTTDDATITDGVCARLDRVAGRATDLISTEAEVIERKPRITRARRPAKAQQTFAQPK